VTTVVKMIEGQHQCCPSIAVNFIINKGLFIHSS
jgi:hypothetical protein